MASATRRRILRTLLGRRMHISGIARELGVSKPVVARHVRILEEAGLLERHPFGKTHVLTATLAGLYSALDELAESQEVAVRRGTTVLEALRRVSGIRVERKGGREYVVSIDGEEGYYLYTVDGSFPDVGMEKFRVEEEVTVELKKLVPIRRKLLRIRVTG